MTAAEARNDLAVLCLDHLKPSTYAGGSWTLDPVALADAIIEAGWVPESRILEEVQLLATTWSELAPEDDWGEDIAATVQADCGRIILAVIVPPPKEDDSG